MFLGKTTVCLLLPPPLSAKNNNLTPRSFNPRTSARCFLDYSGAASMFLSSCFELGHGGEGKKEGKGNGGRRRWANVCNFAETRLWCRSRKRASVCSSKHCSLWGRRIELVDATASVVVHGKCRCRTPTASPHSQASKQLLVSNAWLVSWRSVAPWSRILSDGENFKESIRGTHE